MLYPTGMQYIFPHGFNPIEKIGGNWNVLAENQRLSTGLSADSNNFLDGSYIIVVNDNGNKMPLACGSGINPNAWVYTANASVSGSNLRFSNAGIGVTTTLEETAYVVVDIWERVN